jgi:hypothetical protein
MTAAPKRTERSASRMAAGQAQAAARRLLRNEVSTTRGNTITVTYVEFDREKAKLSNEHGVSLKEAREIFDQVYIVDQKNDDPEHFRGIGWPQPAR